MEELIPEQFFTELQAHLDSEQIIRDEGLVKKSGKNTLGIEAKVGCVIKPYSKEEIQFIVTRAQKYAIALYPISTGCNWGLGSAIPHSKKSVILNLSAMNKITHFDKETGIVTLEPGVTQQMLRTFLDEQRAEYMSSITGAGPYVSIVGNLLDKGLGVSGTPTQSIRAIEGVLADGTIYNEANNPLCTESLNPAIRVGVGPLLDGLFIQNNFAIITSVTLALVHQPKYVSTVYIKAVDDLALAKTINIYHQYNAIHGHGNFCAGRWSKNLFSSDNQSGYSLALIIASSDKSLHKARKKALKRIVKKQDLSMRVLEDKHIRWLEKVFRAPLLRNNLGKIAKLVDLLELSLSYTRGYPNEYGLQEQYELLNIDVVGKTPLDLARDDVGFIWYIVLFPANGASLIRFKNHVYQVAAEHNIDDFRFHALPYKSDLIAGLSRVVFDLNDSNARDKAHAFYNDLLKRGLDIGLVPHRVPYHLIPTLVHERNTYWDVIKKIKRALDPNNLIAPDKYGPTDTIEGTSQGL